MLGRYKNLEVWKIAVRLSVSVYLLTKKFPIDERFGLVSQMRRSSVSIASNIAEGKLRGSDKEFKRFLLISYGSGAELETQLTIARQLEGMKSLSYEEVEKDLNSIMRILNKLIGNIKEANC